ncbi:HD-GYP domain-containing protein [Schlegelella aquatica]|uniref:HD-GYP domain-containing protein n=1 Tax=Caldimonas aquatica TaxID=376175 RepID=UPI003752A957
MKDAHSLHYIDVRHLRVGMHVHLDVGWIDHPFALSSFRIASPEQIATIRSLGLTQVRWEPLRSDPAAVEAYEAEVSGGEPPQPTQPAAPVDAAAQAEQEARRRRRELLAAQQASLMQCERELMQAQRSYKQLVEQVHTEPQSAREKSEALIQGFRDKICGTHETCIRLLTEVAGDRASFHSLNVTVISMLLGKAVGLTSEELQDLGLGALLHDIGKIDLPDRVRWKDEHFTLAELQFYQEHVAHGVSIARKMQLSPTAALVIGQHHEHADGSGFPLRLAGERILVAARIVALVNRYDNLCNPQNPAKAMTPHEALSLMFAQMKSRFDGTILSAFIKMMGVYPPGSVVQLTDDRYAMVVSVNAARPLKPRVIVHDPRVPRDEALLVDLEDHTDLGVRRSLKPLQLPRESLEYLSPRQRICYFFERAREARLEDEGLAA